jgi:hypothetical protein
VKRIILCVCVGLLGVGVAATALFAAYDWFWRAPAMRQKLPVLAKELHEVALPSDARDSREWSSYKGSHALVGLGFASQLSWPDIERHFDGEMTRLGWTARPATPVTVWQRDLGGKSKQYAKPPLTASLYYAGADTSTPSVTLDVTLGLY